MRKLLLVGVAIIAALAIAKGIDFNQNTGGAQVDTGSPGAVMAEVTVPELVGDEVIGQRVFEAKCVTCHGENAAGQEGVAPPLVHKYYEPSHHGDGAFLIAAKNGVRAHHWRFGNMPPVEGITDAEIKLVIAYVRALQRANGIN